MRWIQSTPDEPWQEHDPRTAPTAEPAAHAAASTASTAAVKTDGITLGADRGPSLRGFGGCFNELGYRPLASLDEAARAAVAHDLFSPDECNLSVNRASIGANDFAASWYSYDETPGDYDLAHFDVSRDDDMVIPYIRLAQAEQGEAMQLFASPWSPPTWMKNPPVYNSGRLVDDTRTQRAYARYFLAYVEAYRDKGIRVDQVHVQNEVFADQKFPSCLWSADQLRGFIRDHLGPVFAQAGNPAAIALGTLNGPEDMSFTGSDYRMALDNYARYVDSILLDTEARSYISAIGYQWAGRNAIERTHLAWPEIELMQTESECGDGTNTWEYAEYVFHLVQHYLRHRATTYAYWNMILAPGGHSTWGWTQNSMLTIDPATGEVTRNPEYYVMRHYSHFIRRGARRIATTGHLAAQASAFENPDGEVVVVAQNALDRPQSFTVTAGNGDGLLTVELAPRSFNTIVL